MLSGRLRHAQQATEAVCSFQSVSSSCCYGRCCSHLARALLSCDAMPVGLPVMCSHDVVYNGLCALCGEEVQQQTQQTAASTRPSSSTPSAATAALYDAFHPQHEQELPTVDDLAISMRERNRAAASSSSAAAFAPSSLSSSLSAASHLPLVVGSRLLHLTASAFHRQLADNMRRLHAARKLMLVLDIDHTLLHTTDDPALLHSLPQPLPDSIHSFTLPSAAPPPSFSSLLPPPPPQRLFLRLRPHLSTFLSSLSSLYELHIYTMGSRAYADAVLPIIDPQARLVKGRVVTRTESEGAVKVLERMCAVDASMVAIVDDRVDVWAGERRGSLLRALEFRFFTGREVYDREDCRERDRAATGGEQGRLPGSDKQRAATGRRADESSSSQQPETVTVPQPAQPSAATPSQDEMQTADDEPVLIDDSRAAATTAVGAGRRAKSRRDVVVIDGEPASQQEERSEAAAAATAVDDDVIELDASKRGSQPHSAVDRPRRGRIPRKRPPPAVPLWAEGNANAELPAAAPAASSSSPASSTASSSSALSSELPPPALSQLQPPSPSFGCYRAVPFLPLPLPSPLLRVRLPSFPLSSTRLRLTTSCCPCSLSFAPCTSCSTRSSRRRLRCRSVCRCLPPPRCRPCCRTSSAACCAAATSSSQASFPQASEQRTAKRGSWQRPSVLSSASGWAREEREREQERRRKAAAAW